MNKADIIFTGQYAREKKQILYLCDNGKHINIHDMSVGIGASIPKTSRIVNEMMADGILHEAGKQESSVGRRAALYGINTDIGHFIGVDVCKDSLSFTAASFGGDIYDYEEKVPFSLDGSEESVTGMCRLIKDYKDRLEIPAGTVRACGINLTGRVRQDTGYSYSYPTRETHPLREIIEEQLGCKIFLENDSKAMAYGEFLKGVGAGCSGTVLFLNVSWGLGMGIILNGELFHGKSGFAGEIGHFPMFNNGIICQCGKIGCLETEASGMALHRIFTRKIMSGVPSSLSDKQRSGEEITLDDILAAVSQEDTTAIESIEEVGSALGRAVAGFINLFNPDLVIVGGSLSSAHKYLMPPLLSAVNKYSLNIVNSDTRIKSSALGKKAGAVGACLLAKSRFFATSLLVR